MWWHGHEMIFGVVAAAIAGFLLTAVPVWTGRPALAGGPLAALFGLWAAGRVAFLAAGALPVWLVGTIDAVFLPALAMVLARTLRGTGQCRNYGIVAMVGVLALTNIAGHAEAVGLASPGTAGRALRLGVDGVVLLIIVVGGRIAPAFTTNALRRLGSALSAPSHPWLERVVVGAVVLFAFADLILPRSAWSGVLAVTAGVAAGIRLLRWRGWAVRRDPLLWSLHAGMAWVAAGLLLVGVGDLGAPVPPTAGLHALTAGAMGAMILAVVTRVGLGHTGRPLILPRGAVWCYVLVHAGALARVLAPMGPANLLTGLLMIGGALWAAAFALYAVLYWPILTRPRVDGQPG
jgi:uncharacterized protein involved in response to NO